LKTAGAPAAIKLTLHTAPGGFCADGQDVALIDVEVVDAHGDRCPTDDARVDFNWSSTGRTVSATGPALWLQLRQDQLHQQSLPQHRVRHQPRGHALDSDAGYDHGDG
jgi:hypothetical protein